MEGNEEKLRSECDQFFQVCPPPQDLTATVQHAKDFISRQQTAQNPIALVTSGGTTVPLEKNTVRYLDNFSSGLRGSASAEYFLAHGYAVIFLYRANSLKPFQRHFAKENPLDWLTLSQHGGSVGDQHLKLALSPSQENKLTEVLKKYQKVKQEGTLHTVSFTTVFDYLFYLRGLSLLLEPMGSNAMIYLAAAVSDFYIHPSNMEEHKIQSSGNMELQFSHTPKMLYLLTSKWSPQAFTITFKLETDETLLLPHAQAALEKYHHQAVIANLLGKHRIFVTVVTREGDGSKVTKLELSQDEIDRGTELEELIVLELVRKQDVIKLK